MNPWKNCSSKFLSCFSVSQESTPPTSIGLFGGTFDPIHLGHINLALQLMEMHQLDGVLFSLAALSPHKTSQPPKASCQQRKEMLQLALEPIAAFEAMDWECQQPPPSYMVDTLAMLHRHYPQVGWRLLLGADAAHTFPLWHKPEKILSLAPPLVGGRLGSGSAAPQDNPSAVDTALAQGYTTIAQMDISSSMIRRRLAEQLYCGHLLPSKVLDYIVQNKLYLSS